MNKPVLKWIRRKLQWQLEQPLPIAVESIVISQNFNLDHGFGWKRRCEGPVST